MTSSFSTHELLYTLDLDSSLHPIKYYRDPRSKNFIFAWSFSKFVQIFRNQSILFEIPAYQSQIRPFLFLSILPHNQKRCLMFMVRIIINGSPELKLNLFLGRLYSQKHAAFLQFDHTLSFYSFLEYDSVKEFEVHLTEKSFYGHLF